MKILAAGATAKDILVKVCTPKGKAIRNEKFLFREQELCIVDEHYFKKCRTITFCLY
jgi:hypothetical protein